MSYKSDLIAKIKNPDQWPTFSQGEFLDRLGNVAERALKRRTADGYLAGALVLHQLTEEMLKLLLESNRFFIQLAVYPIVYVTDKKPPRMFGELINRLYGAIDFPNKEKIIRDSQKLNEIRIDLVHKLTARASLSGLAKQAHTLNRLHSRIYKNFDEAYDWFRACFNDYRKDWELR